jgi:hypothetical protein
MYGTRTGRHDGSGEYTCTGGRGWVEILGWVSRTTIGVLIGLRLHTGLQMLEKCSRFRGE